MTCSTILVHPIPLPIYEKIQKQVFVMSRAGHRAIALNIGISSSEENIYSPYLRVGTTPMDVW